MKIGDSLLNSVLKKQRFKDNIPNLPEIRRKYETVRYFNYLVHLGHTIGLEQYLMIHPGNCKRPDLAQTVLALIDAVWLDCGRDFWLTSEFMVGLLTKYNTLFYDLSSESREG